MTTWRKLRGEARVRAPRDSPYHRALAAWELAMDDAAAGEGALGALRERVRVARIRAADRARRAYDALAARQAPFARGLLDAAHAYEKVAWEGEALIAEGERQCAALRARCDALDAEVRREGERRAQCAGVIT
jgi:phage shock protein A